MFKLIVNGKNGREESDFATQAEAQAHFNHHRSKGHWGKEEQVIQHEEIPAVYKTVAHPAEPALKDENGVEVVAAKAQWSEQVLVSALVPAWTETILRQFTWEIKDKTSEVAAIESKKAGKLAKKESMKTFDWSKVKDVKDLKVLLDAIVSQLE